MYEHDEKWEHATPAYEDETEPYATGTVADYDPDWLDGWIEVLTPAPVTRRITRDEFDQLIEEVLA